MNNDNVGKCGHARCAGGKLCYEKGKPMTEYKPVNPRYYTDLKLDSYTACAIAEGFDGEEHTEDELHDAWQYLVDTGMAWKLQGWFGRNAEALIDNGLILPAETN